MNNNKSQSTLEKISNSKRKNKSIKEKEKSPNYIRNLKKIEDTAVPIGVTEAEINTAVKSINLGQNIPKRFTPIKDELIKFDNSKFAKYDIAQLRYELNKDYSNIHPDKENGFLQRMQFDSLKRKNKQDKINELVEKNKYKVNELEREKVFHRLMEDANRRILEKKEKEKEIIEEEEKNNIKEQNIFEDKKYNDEEWNEIYKKRFKEYEECKQKRNEIKRQREKIEKMIKEEEEISKNYITKKLPEQKIKENTQRLYDDAKKRAIIRNKKIKAGKSNYKNNANLASFNDEEDASKYMKSYKSEIYNFNGSSENNSNYYNYNNEAKNYNDYKNIINFNNYSNEGFLPKSIEKNNIKKYNPGFLTEFNYNNNNNNRRSNKRNFTQRKKKYMHNQFLDNRNEVNNFTFNNNNNNNIKKYSDFKKMKIKKIKTNKGFISKYPKEFNVYNNYQNENNENEIYSYKQDNNIVDNYLYNYCINRYFDKNSL